MEKTINNQYVKRTLRDNTMSCRLSIVREVERGSLPIKGAVREDGIQSHNTILNWTRKFANLDRELQVKQMNKRKYASWNSSSCDQR